MDNPYLRMYCTFPSYKGRKAKGLIKREEEHLCFLFWVQQLLLSWPFEPKKHQKTYLKQRKPTWSIQTQSPTNLREVDQVGLGHKRQKKPPVVCRGALLSCHKSRLWTTTESEKMGENGKLLKNRSNFKSNSTSASISDRSTTLSFKKIFTSNFPTSEGVSSTSCSQFRLRGVKGNDLLGLVGKSQDHSAQAVLRSRWVAGLLWLVLETQGDGHRIAHLFVFCKNTFVLVDPMTCSYRILTPNWVCNGPRLQADGYLLLCTVSS